MALEEIFDAVYFLEQELQNHHLLHGVAKKQYTYM